MPRRLPNNSGSAVQLFPFAAVFLCTAGALATLVYGYERQSQRVTLVSSTAAQAREQAEDLIAEKELLEVRIRQLQTSREITQSELATKRRELSHVEDHSRRLRDQAERLSLSITQLERQGGSQSQQVADAKAELERLRRAIAAAELELKEKELENRDRPVTYSVVPYEGPNQTKRRPIYIECRRDSVVIQPEGVALRDQDFEPPLGPGNPLAASIRAYGEHLARAGFTGETTRPYPMLLVRPDGIEAYYAARAALQSWGTEFGYELVGADWTLDFPPTDARLSIVLEQVIADARLRQEALAVAAPRQFNRPRAELRASPNGRGFVADGDSDGRNRFGGTGYSARTAKRGGYGGGARPNGGRSGNGAEWSGMNGGSNSAAGGVYDGIGDGLGDNTGGGLGSGEFAGGPGGGGESSSTGGNSFDSGFNQQGGGSPTGTDRYGKMPGNAALANGSGSGAESRSDGRPSSGSAGGEPGAAGGGSRFAPGGKSGEGGAQQEDLGPLGSPGQGFEADSQQAASGGSGSARTGGPPGGAGSPQSGSSSGGSPSAGGGSSSQGDSQPSQSATAHVSSGQKPQSIASKRGADWGLPDGSSSMVPVTRPVIIRCEPNQLTIVPDDNRSLPRTIPMAGRTDASVDKLVSSVWDHMKGWGLAGRGMYWRPTLSMDVAPGAEARFIELQSLLQDSGLEVKRRQSTASGR